MDLLLIAGVVAVVGAVGVAWVAIARGPSGTARANLFSGGLDTPPRDLHDVHLATRLGDRAVSPLVDALARLGRRVTPAGQRAGLARRLARAGQPWGIGVEQFVAVKVGLAAAVGVLLGLAFVASPSAATVVWILLAVPLAFFAPDLLLPSRAKARQDLVRRALPDTIDQLSILVEAGLGLDAALARVARSYEGPLADELTRTLQDVQAGLPRGRALHELAERTDVTELRQFVHALVQAERNGVPIAHVLRLQSDEMRVRRQQFAEERAAKLPVKIVLPLVVCILPSMLGVIVGPAVIRILRDLGS
jgi:tight adherence protein C